MSLWLPGSAAPGLSPPNLLPVPSPLAGGVAGEAGKVLTLCKHCSQQLTHPRLTINLVFIKPQNIAPYGLLQRKWTVPAKTSTPSQMTMKCGNRVSRNMLGCFCWWRAMELRRLSFCNLLIFVVYLRNFTSVFPSAVLKVLLWHCWLEVIASAAKHPTISLYWRSPLSTLHHAGTRDRACLV